MGEIGELYRDIRKEKQAKRKELEPKRWGVALNRLKEVNCTILKEDFDHKYIRFRIGLEGYDLDGIIYPFNGYWQVTGAMKGRGIDNLISRIEKTRNL